MAVNTQVPPDGICQFSMHFLSCVRNSCIWHGWKSIASIPPIDSGFARRWSSADRPGSWRILYVHSSGPPRPISVVAKSLTSLRARRFSRDVADVRDTIRWAYMFG